MTHGLNRRHIVLSGLTASAGALLPGSVFAQAAFPNRTVTIVVPSAPGGALDILARRLAQKLSDEWKTPVIVENKNGGVGSIGTGYVVRSKPDGHTMLLINTPVIQTSWLMPLPYDPVKDLIPLVQLTEATALLAVHKNTPANTLEEFVAMVKAAPGKYNYASFGTGTSPHIYGVLFSQQAGLDMTHVPYNGAAPMVNALLGGHVTAGFIDPVTSRANAASLKPLATLGAQRTPIFPTVPTLKEKGYHSFDGSGWTGLFLPAGTPDALVARLSADIMALLRQPEMVTGLEALNFTVRAKTPSEFADLVKRESAFWGKVIRENNIKQGS